MVGLSLLLTLSASETIILLIQFTIHLLSLHPEHQTRIRNEVKEVMKKHGVSELKFEVIQDLYFTQQCIYESARLYHFLPILTRQCTEDFQIPGTKYFLRKGDKILIAAYSMQRDAKHFRNPLQFDPDRFGSENGETVFPEAYWSFGNGPRKCLGYKQGLIVVAAFVASLLHKYDVKPHSHAEQMDATNFHPRGIPNISKRDILIDITRCDDLSV